VLFLLFKANNTLLPAMMANDANKMIFFFMIFNDYFILKLIFIRFFYA